MSEKYPPDIDDIDAFLSADATGVGWTSEPPEESEIDSTEPSPEADPIRRLDSRLTHVFRSLSSALIDVTAVKGSFDGACEESDDFECDVAAWDRVIESLEGCSAFAAHENAAADIPEPDDNARLLATIEAQENRIRELEERLSDSGEPEEQLPDPYVNRLIVALNGMQNLKFPLDKNLMTIGRDPGNDIQIRSRYVSREHARIVCDADGASIEDLASRNGVAVNGTRVERRQLRSGDLIDLGKVQLKFIDLMEGCAGEGRA